MVTEYGGEYCSHARSGRGGTRSALRFSAAFFPRIYQKLYISTSFRSVYLHI